MKKLRDWVLWSPRRAIGAATGLLVVAFVALTLGLYVKAQLDYRRDLAAYQQAQAGQVAAPETGQPAPGDDHGHGTDSDEEATPADDAAIAQAAATFVALWLDGSGRPDHAAWVAQVSPSVVPGLVPFLEATPTKVIPDTTLTGVQVTSSSPLAGTVTASLANNTTLEVSVSNTGQAWIVDDYGPTTR